MDFKIMKCPVCGASLEVGDDEKYIVCRACDTPLMLNEERHLFRDDEAENFGYRFEKGRLRARSEQEKIEAGQRGTYYPNERNGGQGYSRGQRFSSEHYYDQYANAAAYSTVSDKERWTAFIICLFFGILGVHYLYLGNVKKFFLYFFTGGLLGFGWLIDIICLLMGTFKDQYGRPLVCSSEQYRLNTRMQHPGNGQGGYAGPNGADPAYGQRGYAGSGGGGMAYGQGGYAGPGGADPMYGNPGNDLELQRERRNERNRRIFLILMILGILAIIGSFIDGNPDGMPAFLIWTGAFAFLWYRTPKPRQ